VPHKPGEEGAPGQQRAAGRLGTFPGSHAAWRRAGESGAAAAARQELLRARQYSARGHAGACLRRRRARGAPPGQAVAAPLLVLCSVAEVAPGPPVCLPPCLPPSSSLLPHASLPPPPSSACSCASARCDSAHPTKPARQHPRRSSARRIELHTLARSTVQRPRGPSTRKRARDLRVQMLLRDSR
jgi:hypothetical protein